MNHINVVKKQNKSKTIFISMDYNKKSMFSAAAIVIGSLFQVDKKKKKNTNVNLVTYKL